MVPSAVPDPNGLTSVTPSVGERIVVCRLLAIEPQARDFLINVNADKCLWSLPVSITLDRIGHTDIFAAVIGRVKSLGSRAVI
jgi:hypothetical protein